MPGVEDRTYWIDMADRLARPVLGALAERRLARVLPRQGREERSEFAALEAFGRLLLGISPWLALDGGDLAALAREGIDAATDPGSPDFMNFGRGQQPLVDASFLAGALLRGWGALWEPLPERVRANVIAALASTRDRKPGFNNWLLFAGCTEAFLRRAGADWDPMRVDYALRQHMQWYAGDGAYNDGPEFHWDYYNSYVIHPLLVDILDAVGGEFPEWARMAEPVQRRARRYAEVLERLIAPDGTFPPLGRSITYRCGAFHALAQAALHHNLPEAVTPAQVRGALTATIRRTLEPAGAFDDAGFLSIGLHGHQPSLAESYITPGSVYLASCALLPLGLPSDDPFWRDDNAPWTQVKVWRGDDLPADKAWREG